MNTIRVLVACCAGVLSLTLHAEPLTPTHDAQVVELLPAAAGGRAQERQLRREWAAHPDDAAKAVTLSRRYLDQARIDGDPRRAGLALAALRAWPDPGKAPDDVLLMLATIEQYLHDFDTSASHLEQLVARLPRHAQAWLMLATVRRVQGRYAASDASCQALADMAATLHAQACFAENLGLRGDFDAARRMLLALERGRRIDAPTRNWLLTTLAETEARAGRVAEAERAYRAALLAQKDAYTNLSYADFLLLQQRDADVLALLKEEPRNDAVLLRLAIAGSRVGAADARRDVREMRDRIALANQRPDARTAHAREQAMFALWVDKDASRAFQLARIDVRHQREPLDLLVLALAARATGRPEAAAEADALRKDVGFHDQRLEARL